VFGTIAAESQRLINETYPTFVQQFMPHYGQPDADSLDNISAAIIVDQQRLGGNYSASPIWADGRIYFLSEEGVATVIAPGRVFSKLAVNQLDGTTLASIAVSAGSLFIRSDSHLYRIGVPDSGVGARGSGLGNQTPGR